MAADAPIKVTVVTPERAVLETNADSVVLPAADGEVGVLPRHAPLVVRLGAGELRIVKKGVKTAYYVEGGFAQVRGDDVSVLATLVRPVDELKADELQSQLAEIVARTPATPAERRERTEKICNLNAALRLTRRSKHQAAL
jgi:F-type H+-transporting ATPase subunit epsilon